MTALTLSSKYLENLPTSSGCYLFFDEMDRVIYIGKAKNIRKRVSSYFFENKNHSLKTKKLVTQISRIEYMITGTDAESYILENNLIKQHTPKYNIMLRDDKSFPYIQINWGEDYPRLEYTRKPQKNNSVEVLGPFPTGSNISSILKVINQTYQLRDCSLSEFKRRKEPCILYQMNQCSAPCVAHISKESYQGVLQSALKIFSPQKYQQAIGNLREQMLHLAEQELFEKASILRDQINQLEIFCDEFKNQSVDLLSDKNIDVIGLYIGELETDLSIYSIRNGLLLGFKHFSYFNDDFFGDIKEDIIPILIEFYNKNILPEILIIDEQISWDLVSEVFPKIKIKKNKSAQEKALLESTKNHALESQKHRQKYQQNSIYGLVELQKLLKLEERPKWVECYDIAIWQGKSPTASQVVFYEGKSYSENYRYYHLTELPEGNNDFAMMEEVFRRRMQKNNLPDLFVVDGGKGQLNVFVKILKELKVNIPVVSLAKDKRDKGERLFIPKQEGVRLKEGTALFRLLTSMRDEAHRYSRKLHHHQEKKRIIFSWLSAVKIPIQDKRKIMKLTFSVSEIKRMSVADMIKALDVSKSSAEKIAHYLALNSV